jgi:hypothetical protein
MQTYEEGLLISHLGLGAMSSLSPQMRTTADI